MAYKLNEEWFEKNTDGVVSFRGGMKADMTTESGRKKVSKDKNLLKMLFDINKPYIYEEVKKLKKNTKVNGIKETAGKKEEKQVSTKASEKK